MLVQRVDVEQHRRRRLHHEILDAQAGVFDVERVHLLTQHLEPRVFQQWQHLRQGDVRSAAEDLEMQRVGLIVRPVQQ